jgi:KaiC/GvpD/RAD55 family RecA-like ATPase
VNDRKEQIDDFKGTLIVVEGGIGYGKTQLCLTFAYRNRERYDGFPLW